MPTILTLELQLTDEETALLDRLIQTEGTDENRDQFATRIAFKGLRGQMAGMRDAIRQKNLRAMIAAFDDPNTTDDQRSVMFDLVGLKMDGLVLKKKVSTPGSDLLEPEAE